MTGFISRYPDADLRTAKDGQYVKVTGAVTCGNFPLESSFQRVPICVYTSTCLYEYRGWEPKSAHAEHCRLPGDSVQWSNMQAISTSLISNLGYEHWSKHDTEHG